MKISISTIPLLKIISFLCFQITQIEASRIKQNPLLNFLEVASFNQHSKCTKRLFKKWNSNQHIILCQILITTSQCKKRCDAVSSSLPQTTQLLEASSFNTPLKAKSILVGILSRSKVQTKAKTFNGDWPFQIRASTLSSLSGILSSIKDHISSIL